MWYRHLFYNKKTKVPVTYFYLIMKKTHIWILYVFLFNMIFTHTVAHKYLFQFANLLLKQIVLQDLARNMGHGILILFNNFILYLAFFLHVPCFLDKSPKSWNDLTIGECWKLYQDSEVCCLFCCFYVEYFK